MGNLHTGMKLEPSWGMIKQIQIIEPNHQTESGRLDSNGNQMQWNTHIKLKQLNAIKMYDWMVIAKNIDMFYCI